MNAILKWFHYVLIFFLIIITFASTIASIRFIVVDATNYHVFANVSG